MVDVILDKVAHIKKMEEIERKKVPYVIQNCFYNGLCIISDVELTPDRKRDDYYISAEVQAEDQIEPPNVGFDPFIPEQKLKYQAPQPKLEIVFEDDSLSSIFMPNSSL